MICVFLPESLPPPNLMDKVYAKGREVADGFKENLPIIFDEYLSKWNYIAIRNEL
jgi:hypothetical protein